ncbi:MAG: Flp pilus assembly protein TadB [Candidatus Nanohaloarchaea archaeon]|jgi:Flp pilus assembly protein TadB
MNTKMLKLKIKNYWRKNEKLILAIIGAFILGVAIAGLNYVNHQNSLVKFQSSQPQIIDSQNQASFSFEVENPSVAQTQMEVRFEGVAEGNPVAVSINGERFTRIEANSDLVNIPSEQLQEENEVNITNTGLGIDQQRLIYARVTSTTNLQELMFVILNLVALLLIAAPVMYIKYEQYMARKKMQEKFPEFLRDVVEGTRAGMSLPQAIKNTETGSYGPLDQKIEKMNAQLDWGIPFEKVLRNFGEDTGSPVIRRSVDTIIQAYSSGGNIQDVLESVGENIRTIKKLKEKRESQLYGEMITGYVVFFIFIGILVALTEFLLPNLASAQQSLGGSGSFSVLGGGGSNLQENISLYNEWFRRLVYIQAFFSGLIIGKLSEGELKAGFKHMAILFAAGYLAVTFFL